MKERHNMTLSDGVGCQVYPLPDGSYIPVADGSATLYGEAYLAEDQKLTQIAGKAKRWI